VVLVGLAILLLLALHKDLTAAPAMEQAVAAGQTMLAVAVEDRLRQALTLILQFLVVTAVQAPYRVFQVVA
jgi:hypothetical protein